MFKVGDDVWPHHAHADVSQAARSEIAEIIEELRSDGPWRVTHVSPVTAHEGASTFYYDIEFVYGEAGRIDELRLSKTHPLKQADELGERFVRARAIRAWHNELMGRSEENE